MSVIVKTEAVVIKSMKYRETSKIVTFYTQSFGKVAGIVKGARRSKSIFGSSLEPMSYVLIGFYKKEGREIQTVTHCDVIKPFRHLFDDVEKMAIGLALIELINNVSHEQEQNVRLFRLLVSTLNTLDDSTKNYLILLYYFELHLAKVLGFGPAFDCCVLCKRKAILSISEDRDFKFHIERGGLICSRCSIPPGNVIVLHSDILKILRQLYESNKVESVYEIEIGKPMKILLENFLWSFLKCHVTGLRPLNSKKVFSKILDQ